MNEIYWITRLDVICDFLTVISVVCFVISVVMCAFAIHNRFAADNCLEGGKYYNCHMKRFKMFLNYFKRSIIVTLVLTVINIFIPTKNDALLIYGVGGTIDYIKSNDTSKQLPDKCVKAFDKWVENLTKEGKVIGLISHVSILHDRIRSQINVQENGDSTSSLSGPGVKNIGV